MCPAHISIQCGKYYCSRQTFNIHHTVRTRTLNADHVLIIFTWLDLDWVTVFHTFSLLRNRIFSNKSEILNIDVLRVVQEKNRKASVNRSLPCPLYWCPALKRQKGLWVLVEWTVVWSALHPDERAVILLIRRDMWGSAPLSSGGGLQDILIQKRGKDSWFGACFCLHGKTLWSLQRETVIGSSAEVHVDQCGVEETSFLEAFCAGTVCLQYCWCVYYDIIIVLE